MKNSAKWDSFFLQAVVDGLYLKWIYNSEVPENVWVKNENTVLCLYFIVKNGTAGFSLLSETRRLQRVVVGLLTRTLQVLWVVCVCPLLRSKDGGFLLSFRWSEGGQVGRWLCHGLALAGGFKRPGALWVQSLPILLCLLWQIRKLFVFVSLSMLSTQIFWL